MKINLKNQKKIHEIVSTLSERADAVGENISWLQLSIKEQHYLPISEKFVLGTHIEGYYSSRIGNSSRS